MYSFAIILVIISMVSTENPQLQQQQQQQNSPPYVARGWRPLGQQLNLPQQKFPEQTYGTPAQTYGAPPQQEYGPPSEEFEPTTTTQSPFDDEEQQAEDVRSSQPLKASEKLQAKSKENVENLDAEQINPSKGQYLIVLPQQQQQQQASLFYTTNFQPQSAALVNFGDGKANIFTTARLQTVPVLAAPQYPNGAAFYQIY